MHEETQNQIGKETRSLEGRRRARYKHHAPSVCEARGTIALGVTFQQIIENSFCFLA